MKHSHHCIKCDSTEVIKIKGGSSWTGYHNHISTGGFVPVLVTRYLCTGCGYSEEWVDDPKGILKLKKKYGSKGAPDEFV